MKKLFLAFIIFTSTACALLALPVSTQTAMSVGTNWMRHTYPAREPWAVEKVIPVQKDNAVIYFVLNSADRGWVLVAADDASYPILAYSDKGTFEYPITCPATRYWTDLYAGQILDAIIRELPNDDTIGQWNEIQAQLFTRWEPTRDVSPLLSTTWNQDWPYNSSCPADAAGPGGRVYAGCTATAMGQVMKYWQHPATGAISHTYTHPVYGTLSANFGSTTYNWSSMPNSISTVNSHIATLLYQCGVAVDMNYGSAASSSLVFTNDAMKTFFGYDPAAQWDYRANYSDATWISMMRGDLNLGRPIIYQGYDNTLMFGHSFVLDGYRTTQGDFHFNFGWGGAYDGYYTLNNLVPLTGFDFRYGQWAYFNLYPGLNVSGRIVDASANPLSGVTVSFSGSSPAVTTDANGYYSKAVPTGYSGTATPSFSGYAFNPTSYTYNNLSSNQNNQNFTGSLAYPADPSNAVATPVAYNSINVTWMDNSNNETGFLIEYRVGFDLTWYFRSTQPPDVMAFQDVGLMPLTNYQYRVTAFNMAGNSNPAYTMLVSTPPPPPPVNLFTSGISSNAAMLNWTEPGTPVAWDIEFGLAGFTPGTGTFLPMLPMNPFPLGGLQAGTSYDWYVRSFYNPLTVSAWAGPANFSTAGSTQLPYPWSENFEAGLGNMVNAAGNVSSWNINTTLASEGTQSVRNAYLANANEIFTCAFSFDLTTSAMPRLYFDHIAKIESNWDHGYVEISTDGGVTWSILPISAYMGAGNYIAPLYNNPEGPCFMTLSYPTWGPATPTNSFWKTEEFDLSAYQGSNNVMIRFRLKSDNTIQQYGWLIDNIRVMDLPSYAFDVTLPAGVSLGRGLSHDYSFVLTNTGVTADAYFPAITQGNWTYGLYEADGITPLTIPFALTSMFSHPFVVKVTTPSTGVNNLDTDLLAVTVTSAAGLVQSYAVTTTVLLGDTIADAIVIPSLPFTDGGSTSAFNHDYGPYGPGNGLTNLVNPYTSYFTQTLNTSPDVVYQLVLATPTLLSIDLYGSTYDTAVALVTAPGTAPTDVILINDDFYTTPVNYVSYLNSGCSYVPAGTYYIIVGGYGSASGNYTLNVNAATPPAQPTLSVTYDSTADQVILSWTQNPVMRYNIYSDTDPYGSFATVVATNVNSGTYTISPIPSPRSFYKLVEKFCFSYPSSKGEAPPAGGAKPGE